MKISVVIPAYNEEDYLPSCLVSLKNQIRQPDEIIVVDNNSTDRTAAIASEYAATVVSESRQGIWAAAYTGYCEASGDIIVRCDADSIMPETWLEDIESVFKHKDVAAVTGPGRFYGAPKWICRIADVAYMDAYFVSVGSALKRPPLFGSNCAFRSDAWRYAQKSTHHKREDIHDDIDLSYHLPTNARIVCDPKLEVLISARPLFSPLGMLRRYIKGLRSIFIHWPEHAPWKINT